MKLDISYLAFIHYQYHSRLTCQPATRPMGRLVSCNSLVMACSQNKKILILSSLAPKLQLKIVMIFGFPNSNDVYNINDFAVIIFSRYFTLTACITLYCEDICSLFSFILVASIIAITNITQNHGQVWNNIADILHMLTSYVILFYTVLLNIERR